MPIFEFKCNDCDEMNEEIVSFEEADKILTIICSFCGGVANKQITFDSFFMLNGGGWAKDLYEKKKVIPDKSAE